MNMTWHPEHFACEECGNLLANMTFINRNGKPYCKPCIAIIKAQGNKKLILNSVSLKIKYNNNNSIIKIVTKNNRGKNEKGSLW